MKKHRVANTFYHLGFYFNVAATWFGVVCLVCALYGIGSATVSSAIGCIVVCALGAVVIKISHRSCKQSWEIRDSFERRLP